MSARKKSNPLIFFGWWTVLVTGIISGLGHGFYQYGISVFFKDLASELGLNRAITSLAVGIGRLEEGIASPFIGWLADKFGPRWLVIIGICIAGAGMILMNFITAVWHYFVIWGVVIEMGLVIGLIVTVDKTLTNWFIRRRGLALGIKFALFGVFGVVVLQAVTPLVLAQGWRITCLIWGIVMFASVPFAFAFVRQKRPEYYGLLPDGAKIGLDTEEDKDEMIDRGIGYASSLQEMEYSFRQAIRTRAYWMLTVAYCIQGVAAGFNIHVIPFLTDFGIDPTTASSMMGIMVFFTIPSRFLGGFIADRVQKSHLQFLLAGSYSLRAIGIITFLLYQNTASIYVLLICNGLSAGSITVLLTILGRFFGRKAFGSIFGTILMFAAPIGFLAPIYSGWIYDTTGSYITALSSFVVLAMLSISITCLVRAPKGPP